MWFFIWMLVVATIGYPLSCIGMPFAVNGDLTTLGMMIVWFGSIIFTYFIVKKMKATGHYPVKKEKPPKGPKVINNYYYINNKGEAYNKDGVKMDLAPPPADWIRKERNKAKKLRPMILERDNYTCQKCGNSIANEPNLLLEVDHIIPVSKWGASVPENLQTLCWKCNRSKGSKTDEDDDE